MNRHSAFTLMEVMVSLLIASILLLGTFSIYAGVLDAAEDVETSSDTMQMVRVAMLRISSDIRSSLPPSNMTAGAVAGNLFLLQPEGIASGASEVKPEEESREELTVIEFSTLSGLNSSLPPDGPMRVAYVLVSGSDQDVMRLVRRQYSPLSGSRFDVELLDNAVDVSFQCRDESGRESEVWPIKEFGTEKMREGLPFLVRIGLIVRVPEGEDAVFQMDVHPYEKSVERPDEG